MIRKRLFSRKTCGLAALLGVTAGMVAGATAHAGLIIKADTTDPSFNTPGSSVGADAKAEVNAAVTLFQTQFAHTDTLVDKKGNMAPVSIYFILGSTTGGASSRPTQYTFSYAQYTDALNTAAKNTGDPIEVSAVKNLGSGNGSGGTGKVITTSADARMLSADGSNLCASAPAGTCSGALKKDKTLGGTYDGVITLSNQPGELDYNRADNFTKGKFDAMRLIEHETDEVLGIGGFDSQLPGNTNANGTIGSEDLFRYSAKGTPSLTTNPNAAAFFSIDGGTTNLANFNQGFNNTALGNCLTNNPENCGDFGDWANKVANTGPNGTANGCGLGLVQDAFACAKQNADISLTSVEGVALQAIGYDPVPAPLIGVGLRVFLAMGGAWFGAAFLERSKKRRSRKTAVPPAAA